MRALFVVFVLAATAAMAQDNNIAQFAVWKPKAGQEQNFETGYKKHLLWHQANGDTWNWYGWFCISGPRDGLFIDATFGHAWKDFDQSVKPAEDGADNVIHVEPFGEFQYRCKVAAIKELSFGGSNGLQSKILRLITLNVTTIPAGMKLLEKLKNIYQANKNAGSFLPFKMVDGGNANQFILLLGFDSFAQYGQSENLQEEITAADASLPYRAIVSITSETLVYRADLSLLPARQ